MTEVYPPRALISSFCCRVSVGNESSKIVDNRANYMNIDKLLPQEKEKIIGAGR